MQEDFLYFIWEFQLLKSNSPLTSCGKQLIIESKGYRNKESGPDYSLSRLKIDGQAWVGDVEMHLKSSDWLKHGHQHDPAYDKVILHVVWEHDREIHIHKKGDLPVLELKDLVLQAPYSNYKDLLQRSGDIPCSADLLNLDPIMMHAWWQRLTVERLELKCKDLEEKKKQVGGNLNELIYRTLCSAFGLRLNQHGFEQLAKAVPYKLVAKYRDQRVKLEALFFGQAGFLSSRYREKYPKKLWNEYLYLKKLHGLQELHPGIWKRSGMNPSGLPTMRIAQLTAFLFKVRRLPSVLTVRNKREFTEFLKHEPSEYWKEHFVFGRKCKTKSSEIGNRMLENIILNALIPLVFQIGIERGNEEFRNRAMEFLSDLPAEKNAITRKWKDLGIEVKNAEESQALIQCFHYYCTLKNCVSCSIGKQLLMRTK